MEVKMYSIPVEDVVKQFLSAIQPLQTHNYDVNMIFSMVIDSLKLNNANEIAEISRFCMYFSERSPEPVMDTQIMTTAIMDLRNDLFRFLKLFNLVDMNADDPFIYGLRFHSLKYNTMLIEVTKP